MLTGRRKNSIIALLHILLVASIRCKIEEQILHTQKKREAKDPSLKRILIVDDDLHYANFQGGARGVLLLS
jgi:hypothetical protein